VKKRKSFVRLYFVGALFVVIALGLWARLIQVQVVRSAAYREEAARQKVVRETIQPVRGCIYDRHGRPLALNVRRESVSLSPPDVTDYDKVARAVSRELRIPRREVLAMIRSGNNFVWLKRQCELSDKSRKNLTALKGVEIHLEQSRIYPYGDLAAKIIGFVDVDNRGLTGIEAAFKEDLEGVAGTARVIRNGSYETDRYYRFVEQEPVDGRHIYLTIDVATQEIAEAQLERAIAESGARSGVIIVMDVESGEILALAESPSPRSRSGSQRADSLWTIRSVSHIFEPGSTFKLVTAAALLDLRRVAPADTFDAENGRARLGAARITDPHPYGRISFEEAFAYSSNIVFYKVSERLEKDEFYKYIRWFGFGQKTGIQLLGESAGSVAETDRWSGRTRGTMAFGQEIAVTPMQMVAAFAVPANDGVMVLPRIVRGIADDSSGDITRTKRLKVRPVMRRTTARTLMEFCRRAVVDGTGKLAEPGFMEVAGKTGTGQKASARGGYLPGKYVSSFIGFAPHDDPRIVALVLLDEPDYKFRFGGVSCAPVFARLCAEMANATATFDGVLASAPILAPPEVSRGFPAPNFIRMERSSALENARKLGCNVLCQGDEGRVVAQTPGPGTPMDRDDVIRLLVSSGAAGDRGVTPDLRGLSVREAKAVAAKHGLKCTLVGSGVVTSQAPAPGRKAGRQTVKLYCDAGGRQRSRGAGGGSR
jgi:stage V sporulation protein D (sporulation-specific penicillin-binding protein)